MHPIETTDNRKDTPSSLDNEAATIWANAIRETGLWLSPFAENVAELGRLIIPRMQQAIRAARAEEMEANALIADYLGAPEVGQAIRDAFKLSAIRATEKIGESEERTP